VADTVPAAAAPGRGYGGRGRRRPGALTEAESESESDMATWQRLGVTPGRDAERPGTPAGPAGHDCLNTGNMKIMIAAAVAAIRLGQVNL
jgi:hypothetical protein